MNELELKKRVKRKYFDHFHDLEENHPYLPSQRGYKVCEKCHRKYPLGLIICKKCNCKLDVIRT